MRSVGKYLRSWFGRFDAVGYPRRDPWLWLPAGALITLGLLMVLNTTYFIGQDRGGDAHYVRLHYFELHLFHIALGMIALTVLSQFSLRGLRRLVYPMMVVSVLMLIAVWIPGLGLVRGGARRWLRVGPVLAEPSELVKLAVVFFLAEFLAKRQERMENLRAGPLSAMIIVGPIALMVLEQPDFGTTVMLAVLLFAMLFAAGAKLSHLGASGAAAVVILAAQAVRKTYRMRRLTSFLHPWQVARGAGFQLMQSFVALAAGGNWGVGLGAGRQKMFYLPQAHTDFIFAVIGEELGVAGAIAVVALFGVIMWRGLRIAHEEPDPFGSLLAVGLTSLLSLQALINMAVVIGMIPTKGLPLPFLSYGGTAMVMSMATLGALLALGRRPAMRRA